MKISRLVLFACIVLMLSAATPGRAYHRGPRLSLDVSVFYDGLASYGAWYSSPRLGLVWAPYGVGASWQPYTYGRWAYTDFGWTWVSDFPWGWAPFHYGRWDFDPVLGWVWVPGNEWAPAWVDFYLSDGWVGWAPLAPGAGFYGHHRYRDPDRFVFVPERQFLAPRVGRWNGRVSRRRALLRRAADVTRFRPDRGGYVNRSLPVDRIERATHRRVTPYRIVGSRSRGPAHRRGREIEMFRPRIGSSRPSHRPAVSRMPAHRVGTAAHAAASRARGRARAPSRDRGRGREHAVHPRPPHAHGRPPTHRSQAVTHRTRGPRVSSHRVHRSPPASHRARGSSAASHRVHRSRAAPHRAHASRATSHRTRASRASSHRSRASRPASHRSRASRATSHRSRASRATSHRSRSSRVAPHRARRQRSSHVSRSRGRAPARHPRASRRARGRHHGHGRPPA